MLFRKHIVSTRTLLQLAVATIFSVAAVGAAYAANSGIAPMLVPYTVNTIAGTPQFVTGTTTVPIGYFGEGVPATPTLASQTGAAIMDAPFAMAVDSVGNVYITDRNNYIIREVNAQTGLINTIAGVVPQACSGYSCTVRKSGCSDGVVAAGSPIGTGLEGIAVDIDGNVYFVDNATASVSVIYRGGTREADFINRVNPGGVAASGGTVKPGYVYHVAGTVDLSSCGGSLGNTDNTLAFENAAAPGSTPGAELHNPGLVTLDSAGNIYIADISNSTVRVVNTQETPQTFFQFTVQPGYMRSITNCNAALTIPCPSATTTNIANTGINGPVDGIVFNSQFKEAEVDAYGNIYQLNGTGGGTGPPGIYAAAAYAGGAPLTNLLTAEAPLLAKSYGPIPGNAPAELPLTYGNSYIAIGNPTLSSPLPGANTGYPDNIVVEYSTLDIRPSSLLADNFGSLWYMDNHYPYLERIDQYTGLATMFLHSARATANISPLNPSSATFDNPYYCVYGNTSSKIAWTQGPQTYDPQGDGCPAVLAYFNGGNYQTVSDGLGNIYVGDANEELVREMTNGNIFPPTPVGTSTPVTQAIQVHFNQSNLPAIGAAIPDGPTTGNTTTAFSIAPGISDFTINTTTPEFPMGSLLGGNAQTNSTTTPNFQMWAGLPTCTLTGQYPNANKGINDLDCLVYVTFNPTAPGIRQSQLVVTTANGSVYNIALYGVATGGQLAIDGGAAIPVPITGLGNSGPAQIAVSQSGTTYVTDPSNNQVIAIPAGGGTQTTIGTGLSGPMGVAVDAANNVYISDTGNNRVVEVNPITNVQTVLGNYAWIAGPGNTPPPQYAFKAPQGLAVNKWNNVYVADTGNGAVVEIPSNIALGGAAPLLSYPGAPKFSAPVAVTVDSQGNVYVADPKAAGGAIIILPPGGGDLATVPGTTFPSTKSANVLSPSGVAVDAAGNLYVTDSSSNTVVELPSGSGPGSARFVLNFPGISSPSGIALDANGNLYVADSGNKQVLFDNRQNPVVNFGKVPQDLSSPAQPVCVNSSIVDGYNVGTTGSGCPLTVTNIGTDPVTLTSPFVAVSGTGNAAYSLTNLPGSISCTSPLPAGLTCQITPTFTPTMDNGQSENVNVNGGTQTLALAVNGTGAQPLADIVLSASYSTGTAPTAGATATITATVTQPHIAGNIPSGTVTFTYVLDAANKNANNCGSGGTLPATLNGAGIATITLPVLAQGVTYTITANYNGDLQNSANVAAPLLIAVPGIPETVTITSTAAQLTFLFGGTPPVPLGTVTPPLPSGVTVSFGSAALPTTNIGSYDVVASFSGPGACSYGYPPSVYSTGGAAKVTENPAPLTYNLPNFTAEYGSANISFGALATVTGAVNGDTASTFSATFTPSESSLLNVGTYQVTPVLSSTDIGNYLVTAPPSTLTITQAQVNLIITGAQTAVPSTAAGVASATYQITVGTAVTLGKGLPTGTVTVTDNFTPITPTGYGTPAAPVTTVVTLTAGSGSYVPTDPTAGIHQYSYAYSGDTNFQPVVIAPSPTAAACIPTAITANCLIVDNPDFTLTSDTGPVIIIPGVVPSGNGLLVEPNQSTAAPETAVLFVKTVLGFTGSVSLSCQPQNPTYVSCFMTPTSVCFATASSPACTNTATTAAAVVAISTPASLPLGFKISQVRTAETKTVLAFLPLGFLAFCVRRRRRLSKALWMLIAVAAIGAGMSGCGGNQVNFYTPIPTGVQNVTVTATYLGNGSTQPAATRSFVVPIAID